MINGKTRVFSGYIVFLKIIAACISFQRHIWEQCGCLDIGHPKPLFDRTLMCGYSAHRFAMMSPGDHNISHCLAVENMTSLPECVGVIRLD